MEFLNLLKRESKDFDRQLLIAGGFAGLVSTFLIFTLTAAANKAAAKHSVTTELLLVAVALGALWMSKNYLMRRTTMVVEEVIKNIRLRIGTKLRNSDLASYEAIGKAPFYNAISSHATAISRAAPAVVSAATSLVLLSCALAAIFFLSSTAFLILIATLGAIISVLYFNREEMLVRLAQFNKEDNQFVKGFDDMLDGFKELKMHSGKNHDFFHNHLEPKAEVCREIRVNTGMIVNQSVLVASCALYVLLASIILFVPTLSPADTVQLARIATLVVFIFGPLGEVVSVFPLVTEATNSIREINRIEERLNSIFESGSGDPVDGESAPLSFTSLRCHDLTFGFRDEKGEPTFSLAPINLEIAKGELLFITGGNGSGKSTFLKVLAALYPPASGCLYVGGTSIGPSNRQAYRNLFSTVFTDFHLFDAIYGLETIDRAKLDALLDLTELRQKITIEGTQISTTRLSTGQRKRLALVLTLLEDRPIVILDEWAADQDPQFRRKFYREILPALKESGKTIIAVTHDDEFYSVADRVLKMQYGEFVAVTPVNA